MDNKKVQSKDKVKKTMTTEPTPVPFRSVVGANDVGDADVDAVGARVEDAVGFDGAELLRRRRRRRRRR